MMEPLVITNTVLILQLYITIIPLTIHHMLTRSLAEQVAVDPIEDLLNLASISSIGQTLSIVCTVTEGACPLWRRGGLLALGLDPGLTAGCSAA
jgi:hypothetical protein